MNAGGRKVDKAFRIKEWSFDEETRLLGPKEGRSTRQQGYKPVFGILDEKEQYGVLMMPIMFTFSLLQSLR